MDENRYSPPKAAIEDVVAADAERKRPQPVVLAVQLGAVSYLLGLVVMIVSWDYYSRIQPLTFTLISQGASLAFTIWIYYKVWVGRNWARVTFLVFSVLGILFVFNGTVWKMLTDTPMIAKVQMVSGAAISIVTIYLLFTSPGREWFRSSAK